jgi:hypothetical protein
MISDKKPPKKGRTTGRPRPRKRNNPGKYSMRRVPYSEQKLKKFVNKVFDKKQPLIKPDKVEKEKQPKDKNRYKWENYYDTDTRPKIRNEEGKKVANPDYGKTSPRGKTKGPKLDTTLSLNEQGTGTHKWKIRGRGKQSDIKGYPGVRSIRSNRTNFKDKETGEIYRDYKSTTKYKRSSAGYSQLTRKIGDKETRTSFPTRKQLKEHNRWTKEHGLEKTGPAIRKTKSVDNSFRSDGEHYVKTYYRGKLKPTIKHYQY